MEESKTLKSLVETMPDSMILDWISIQPGDRMKHTLTHNKTDKTIQVQERLIGNPLIEAIRRVLLRVEDLKKRGRLFYLEVVLSPHQCTVCGGQLRMICQSKCACSCGNAFDPTLAFQQSLCCGARLVRKTFHYACSKCGKTTSSRFIFDEKLFDAAYFREMMRESRERTKRKKEEIRRLLAESRSSVLQLTEEPSLGSIPGLIQDLDNFIREGATAVCSFPFDVQPDFRMNDYHDHIISNIGWSIMLFSDIAPFIDDHRRDRVWRFITLIFMQNDREVELTQDGTDIWVQKVYDEAYN